MNTGQALRAVRTFATGCVVAAAMVAGTASMTVSNAAAGGHGDTSKADTDALWWPRGKIAARYLGPYLAEFAGLMLSHTRPAQVSIKPSAKA